MKRKTIALALAVSLLSVASSSFAVIDKGYLAVYYSDANYDVAVGEGGIGCMKNNKYMSWGVATPYYIVYDEFDCFIPKEPPRGGM